jgi:hypothetical protein
MSDTQQAVVASASAQETINELRAEGASFEGLDPKPEVVKTVEVKTEPVKEEVKPEVEAKPEKEAETEEVEKPRTSKYVPVGTYNEMRKEAQAAKRLSAELQAKLQEMSQRPNQETSDEIDKLSAELAEKHNIDKEFLKDLSSRLTSVVSKKSEIPSELANEIAEIKQMKREQAEEFAFEKQFEQISTEFPDVDKKAFKQLAFTQGNEQIPLRTLAIQYMHDNPKRKTAEGSSGGQKSDVIDFAHITEEQETKLSDEDFDKLVAYRKRSGGWNN